MWIRTLLSAKAELLLQPSSSSQIPPALGGHPGLASFSLCPSNSVPAVTLSDSVLIVTVIFLDHRLHIPFIGNQLTVSMWDVYIFPNMLSISENSYAVAVVPCILSGLLSPPRPIASQDGHAHSSPASLVQPTMLFLLLATQPDHCVAICNPCGSRSSYSSKFSRKTEPEFTTTAVLGKRPVPVDVCVSKNWPGRGLGQVTSVFGLPFWDALVIFHFFCDVRPLLKLACVDTPVNEIINFVVSVCVLILPTGPVFFSYVLLVSTSLKIPSARGRKKAFATCTSRLTVVIVHCGCASAVYLKPKSQSSVGQDRLISVTYTVLTPLLSPVVYSLGNKEVKGARCRAVAKTPLNSQCIETVIGSLHVLVPLSVDSQGHRDSPQLHGASNGACPCSVLSGDVSCHTSVIFP
ncbi:LOW QUALITY PROTEIN: olfactory receptor 10J4-like [Panthera onca]